MATVGFATLDVIPSFKGFQGELEKGTVAPLASAGKRGGAKFGDAAGREAGTRFKGRFTEGIKNLAAPLAGIAIGAGVADFFKDAFAEAKEAGQVSRVTAKLIETTGHAANLTATQVGALAEKMMDYAAVDDEMVQSGANIMLSFRNVRNEAGKGNDIFDRSIKAGLDLAAVLGTDLSSSAVQLGKALNDPIKGVTALGRAGVQFTQQQKDQIKALVESGDLLSAQKIVLDELEGQVGGAAGAAADGTDRLSVALGNLKEAAGTQLLPAIEGFSNWAADEGIPMLTDLGGATVDAAQAFGELPGPVKASAAAFVALRLASATGLASGAASGVASLTSSLTGLRIRTMLAADAFREARSGVLTFAGNTGQYIMPVGRLSASLQGLRAGAQGAGAALRSGLSGAVSMLGGGWTIALVAGTALLTKFWQEHQEAKQHVEELTASLDKQTGAITRNTKEEVANALQKSGVIDLARKWGVELDDLTRAAMGNTAAQGRVNEAMDAYFRASKPAGDVTAANAQGYATLNTEADKLRGVIGGQNEAVASATQKWRDHAELMGRAATATDRAAQATRDSSDMLQTYARRIDGARDAILDLWAAENKRRLSAVQDKRDRLGLIATMQAARKEAREGKRTLDENTEAGQENWQALLDLADQWNTSTGKVRNAKGAYKEMREQFVDIAVTMGETRKGAELLADKYVTMPKSVRTEITTPGMEKALEDLREYRLLARNMKIRAEVAPLTVRGQAIDGFASGGKVGGYGTGDKRLILADPREWVMNPQASAYYGDGFMAALNRMQIPRFAGGGPVSTVSRAASGRGGGNTYNVTVVADDPWKFKRDMEHMTRGEAIGAVDFR